MKRKIIIGLLIVIVGFSCIKFFPFGTEQYQMPTTSVTLEVPKLSALEEECCMYSVSFKSVRSRWNLQRELDNSMKKYEKMSCQNQTYYYDRIQDITILEYGVMSGFITNTFYITYDKGNYCKEEVLKDDIDEYYHDALVGNYKPIRELDKTYDVEAALKDYNFVITGAKVYNDNLYEEFMNHYYSKESAFLRIIHTTIEGDIIINDVKYDASRNKIMIVSDNTRDKFYEDKEKNISLKEYESIGIYNNGKNELLVAYSGELTDVNYYPLVIIN